MIDTHPLSGKKKEEFNTLAGGVGFLPKASEDPNRFDLSVFLKKSSDEAPLKGSLSLKGSSPNGSRKGQDSKLGATGCGIQSPSASIEEIIIDVFTA